MTLPSPVTSNSYVGNGLLSSYAYGFFIFSETHLQVQVVGGGKTYNLQLNVDYLVTAIQNPSGANINLINNGQAWLTQVNPKGNLLTGYVITISRVVPMVQDTSIRDQAAGYQSAIEDALDYLTMLILQVAAGQNSQSAGSDIITSPGFGLVLTDTITGVQYRVIVANGTLGIETI